MSFELDGSNLSQFLTQQAAQIIAGAEEGAHDATDHLLAKSRDIAPLDTGTLRMSSGKEVVNENGRVSGEVFYSVTELNPRTGVRFNYALKVHEMGEYKNPTTPGTRPKFLSGPLQTYERLYQRFIADAIRRAIG